MNHPEIIIASMILGISIIFGAGHISVAIDKLWETIEEVYEKD
jgi:hypothetical protein